ncbi:MAG: glycosyltransferase family 4 protein, partial [Thermogutta sp.]|uniref:glycosyltransferase family 4 protein n=1 Tax=Thermogutta sp. TaxID=1962930 RepID=UPI0019BCAD15
LVAANHLNGHVVFLGTVSDMAVFYRACDVVCIPSRSESFGRTAIEAMAVGTPVVATRVGGLGEIINDGETGLLVEYGVIEGFRQQLNCVLLDGQFRLKLAGAAKDECGLKYSRARYVDSVGLIAKSTLTSCKQWRGEACALRAS